jgi:signal transduction histidine kinase
METIRRVQQRFLRSRWLPVAGIGLTLLILAGTIAYGTFQLRGKIRAQIVRRDADILHGVAQMVQVTQEKDKELGAQLEQLPDQFAVALQITELNQFNGVIATRLFDTNGQFAAALPPHVAQASLAAADLAALKQLKPVSRFDSEARLADIFLRGASAIGRDKTAPLLEVLIPLHRQGQPTLLGAVQFVIDGKGIAEQFAALDRNLIAQAALAFGVGSIIIVIGLAWAFRRLQRANRLLLDRTNQLLRTNEELVLAAKTSAVGAITAHLVHGLSSPLAGLEELVTTRGRNELAQAEWQDAATITRQVKETIAEILRMLGEERAIDRYEISLAELVGLLSARVRAGTEAAGVKLETLVNAESSLPNREANLTLLILENLLKNAIQATPRGRVVRLVIALEGDAVAFEVRDEGLGVPTELQAKLFTPCRSSRKGGHGIGLAICKQLANHLEAALELKSTSASGSVFALRLPRNRLVEQPALETRPRMG